jgi:hypothetical protein
MRRKCLHICNPNKIFKVIAPMIKAALSFKSRQILVVHSGTSDRVLETLAQNSIPSTCLPTDIGGQLSVCLEAFVLARQIIEEGMDDNNIVSDSASSSDGNLSDIGMIQENTCDVGGGNLKEPALDLAGITPKRVSISPDGDDPIPTMNELDLQAARTPQIGQVGAPNNNNVNKTEDRKKTYKSHPGRKVHVSIV